MERIHFSASKESKRNQTYLFITLIGEGRDWERDWERVRGRERGRHREREKERGFSWNEKFWVDIYLVRCISFD